MKECCFRTKMQGVENHQLDHFGISRGAALCTHLQQRWLCTTPCLLFELTLKTFPPLLSFMKDRSPKDSHPSLMLYLQMTTLACQQPYASGVSQLGHVSPVGMASWSEKRKYC